MQILPIMMAQSFLFLLQELNFNLQLCPKKINLKSSLFFSFLKADESTENMSFYFSMTLWNVFFLSLFYQSRITKNSCINGYL